LGRAGPAAEPIPIRKLKGQTKPSLVGGDIFEADPLEELPRPPEWLSRGARAVWRRVGNELVRYRLVGTIDLDLFAHYCAAVDLARRSAVELEGENVTVAQLVAERADGTTLEQRVVKPAFKAWREAVQTMRQLAGEFGLSPAIRASVKLPSGGGAADPADAASLLS